MEYRYVLRIKLRIVDAILTWIHLVDDTLSKMFHGYTLHPSILCGLDLEHHVISFHIIHTKLLLIPIVIKFRQYIESTQQFLRYLPTKIIYPQIQLTTNYSHFKVPFHLTQRQNTNEEECNVKRKEN